MADFLAARSQMAMSLAFHIIFAAVGMAMPLMMVVAEWRWLRTKQDVYLALAKRWAKGTAILFAVGAVSGTVLSFELGLLWPSFMAWSGSIIGLLFSLEGFAFFTEAIFLGIYLHGWHRISPWAHLGAGVVVAISGVASAIFVVIANAWMNTPAGFELVEGRPVHVDPIAAMWNPHGLGESVHMVLAAFSATGFAVAGIHAFLLLRDRTSNFHQRALGIALLIGGIPSLLQPLSGDLLAKAVARHQPAKLAAFEGLFRTQHGAPFRIGGVPDMEQRTMRWSIEIPSGLSLLLYHDPSASVTGLDAFPRDEWPPVGVVHPAFQIMVASGTAMAGVALWAGWQWWRRTLFQSTWLLRAIVCVSPLGFLAIEAGWVVTEVGRQPWIIYGVMRTAHAVTPMPGLIVPLGFFTGLYILLSVVVAWLMVRHVAATAHR
ncbi:MAG: cytochrome ubiquinol oxidase subunit I [Nitrospiraceae bacterium]|nr:cytochrome ubiquinol oxidase subunit I [Nitrospiraceae bacterium]